MTRALGNVKGSENQIGVRIEHEISHTPSEALGLCLLCVFACGNDEAIPGEGTISCPGLNACFLSGDRYGKFPCRSSISRSYGYLLHAERAFTLDSAVERGSFWQDQFSNLERIRQSNYSDVEVGKRVLSEICCIAPHFKRRTYLEDNEWRIVMVSQVWEDVDEHGFRTSGLRDVTLHGDLIDLMEGVAVQRGCPRNNAMYELARFALQQRKPDFKIWV